jgi:hypothetical protein
MRYVAQLVERRNTYFANYAKYLQQIRQIFQFIVLCLKHHTSSIRISYWSVSLQIQSGKIHNLMSILYLFVTRPNYVFVVRVNATLLKAGV